MSKRLFYEVQYLREFRLILILMSTILVIMLVTFGQIIYDVIVSPEIEDWGELIIGISAHLFGIGFLCTLIFFTRLVTEVNKKGLFVRFIPLHFWTKEIDLKQIDSVEAKEYRPIREYGGWGIRPGWKKKAYNVYGNKGVEVQYQSGYKLLIGSQRAEELAEAVQSVIKR